MKQVRLLAAILAGLSVFFTAHAANFADIQSWTGSGTNQAALVINWTDGTSSESLLWGYRWDGTATGEQMLYAIIAGDPRLYAEVSSPTEFGTALFGLGFHPAGDENFTLNPSLAFNSQHLSIADGYATVDDTRAPINAGDLWQEGWFSAGYWSYWLSTDSRQAADSSDWDYSGVGMTGRELSDGDWDGWAFAPGFNGVAPADPTAAMPVPEPGTWAIFILSGIFLVCFKKKHRARKAASIASIAGLALLTGVKANATSLDDIQSWTGTGTNRAALVIHWKAPEVRNNTDVPDPAAEKSLVWGYRFNGTATAEDMFNAVVATDHRLFVTAAAPYPGFGAFIYSIGYDLNNNGVFGLTIGTNVFAENAFTNGQCVFTTEDSDGAQPLDAGDNFWSGSFGANWEMWQEQGGAGGFTNAPDRGPNPYWTPTDTTYFSSGSQGQWDYASSGLEGTAIHDGSWIGFTISAGGLNYLDENDPGTIAYDYHKHAPIAPEPASTNSPYAVQIVAAQGPFGGSPYDDPNSVLGAPATRFYESASKPATRVKIVEPAYNYAPDKTNKLIITLNTGSAIIAKFSQPVYDNPANPYGIDFEVFGNAFYVGNGFSSDTSNMNTYMLTSGGFYEPTKVSVSPGYTGQPGEVADDPSTWPWYRYENGPYDDTDCPTQGYKWNRAGTNWTDEVTDFTKPVNPALKAKLNASGSTLSAADAIDLYNGSGGGTGFDLKESGFASIQYIKVEGLAGFTGGEVDALAIVRPMTIGDTISISPANLTNNTAQFLFQKPGAENQNVLSLNFTNISDIAQVVTARLDDSTKLAAVVGTPVNALQLNLSAILNTNAVVFYADLGLSVGTNYAGNGSDLRVAQWTGTNWLAQSFVFNPANNNVIVTGVTNLSAFVVSQIIPPQLNIQSGPNGFAFQFTPVVNCPQTLERSTDFVTWTPVATFTPTNATPVTLTDTNAPTDKAFYRVRVNP